MRPKGYRPDPPHISAARPKFGGGAVLVPDEYIIPHARPVRDQVGSSCTANAMCAAIELRADLCGVACPRLSAQALYWFARQRHGEEHVDEGSYPWALIDAAERVGICAADDWPDDAARINEQPGLRAAVAGALVTGAQSVTDADGIRAAIAAGHPVIIGVQVGKEFEDYTGAAGVVFSEPSVSLGGHELCLIGYRPGAFLALNSWSSAWGDHGTAWLSEAYVMTSPDTRVVTIAPSGVR